MCVVAESFPQNPVFSPDWQTGGGCGHLASLSAPGLPTPALSWTSRAPGLLSALSPEVSLT